MIAKVSCFKYSCNAVALGIESRVHMVNFPMLIEIRGHDGPWSALVTLREVAVPWQAARVYLVARCTVAPFRLTLAHES